MSALVMSGTNESKQSKLTVSSMPRETKQKNEKMYRRQHAERHESKQEQEQQQKKRTVGGMPGEQHAVASNGIEEGV